MAALTRNATLSAATESMVLNRTALRIDGSSRWKFRDCTKAEWR